MASNQPDAQKARVAVLQAAPVLFDTPKSLQKFADLTADAARQQAELVIFPEAFVGGYYKGQDFGVSLGLCSPQSPAAACIESVARGLLIAPPEVIRHQLAGG